MREEYDFSESIKNPYTKNLRKPVTIRLGSDVIEYFKEMSEETGLPYQTLINLYLKDCVYSRRKLSLHWSS
jgi:predicted DNA binding CopG/RHH family protein